MPDMREVRILLVCTAHDYEPDEPIVMNLTINHNNMVVVTEGDQIAGWMGPPHGGNHAHFTMNTEGIMDFGNEYDEDSRYAKINILDPNHTIQTGEYFTYWCFPIDDPNDDDCEWREEWTYRIETTDLP